MSFVSVVIIYLLTGLAWAEIYKGYLSKRKGRIFIRGAYVRILFLGPIFPAMLIALSMFYLVNHQKRRKVSNHGKRRGGTKEEADRG